MPNRGELAFPTSFATEDNEATADDAFMIVGFCTIGWLISIYAAVSSFGFDAASQFMMQYPGFM